MGHSTNIASTSSFFSEISRFDGIAQITIRKKDREITLPSGRKHLAPGTLVTTLETASNGAKKAAIKRMEELEKQMQGE